jgi:glycosyltransferase involved in cell wall biosynthesis
MAKYTKSAKEDIMKITQLNSIFLNGDAISNIINASHEIHKTVGYESQIVVDFFSENQNFNIIEAAEKEYGTSSTIEKLRYFIHLGGSPHLLKLMARAYLKHRRGEARQAIDSADLRIWHYGHYYSLFRYIQPNDIIYFHNFGYPYLSGYPDIEIESSLLLQALRWIPLHFITPSQFNKKTLLRFNFPEENINVIPLFHKSKLPYISRKPNNNLLTWGRWATNKSIPELVRTAAEASMELTVFGDNSTTSEYKHNFKAAKTMANDKIHLFGKVPEIDQYFRDAGIFISNSRHEGFCVPIIEAEAHSLPVLARRGTAMDELVKEGWNGYLFDNINEIPNLADKILKNYRTFSHNAWRHSQGYTYEKYKKRYLRILKKYDHG